MPDHSPLVTLGPDAPRPGLGHLFVGFVAIGLVGFGGVLPWLRRMMVDQRRWVTSIEFDDMLALCQFLPGPNVVNMSVALGAKFYGAVGSLACVFGLLAAPITIVIALGGVYEQFGHVPIVARAFGGLAAAASSLVIAMAVKIAAPLEHHLTGAAVALAVFGAVALLHLPLLPTMVVMAPVSILLCWRWPA